MSHSINKYRSNRISRALGARVRDNSLPKQTKKITSTNSEFRDHEWNQPQH